MFTLQRLPECDDELHELVLTLFNWNIPRVPVCPDHSSPFDAFADAFFARHPVTVWKASRGFGGKSTLLAVLCGLEASVLGAQVTVLGGSSSQSMRVHEVTHELWDNPLAPKSQLDGDPTQYITRFKNRAWIRALTASQKSARGPHPQRLRLDEIDEMDLGILESAQGQPQEARGIPAQTVMSSTHQYPDKTMTAILKRAKEKGWPVHEWCWRESMGTPEFPGWLTPTMVETKKAEVSNDMWRIEYDLQEPSIEGRAFDIEYVDAAYRLDPADPIYKHTWLGEPDREVVIEDPHHNRTYVTGVDWAKEKDWTVIRTYRIDCRPWREVAFVRMNKRSYPYMVRVLEDRLARYGGHLVHDSTGIGNVVDDLINYDRALITSFRMVGRDREILFNDYIVAHENNELVSPRIEFAYGEHKYCTRDDLFGNGHPPDSVVAGALAWSARNKQMNYANSFLSVTRSSSPWSM
jgi:hypothetical protein